MFKFLGHGLVTLVVNNQSLQASGLHSLVRSLPGRLELRSASVELVVLLTTLDLFQICWCFAESMRRHSETRKLGRESLRFIPQIAVFDAHVASILNKSKLVIADTYHVVQVGVLVEDSHSVLAGGFPANRILAFRLSHDLLVVSPVLHYRIALSETSSRSSDFFILVSE